MNFNEFSIGSVDVF